MHVSTNKKKRYLFSFSLHLCKRIFVKIINFIDTIRFQSTTITQHPPLKFIFKLLGTVTVSTYIQIRSCRLKLLTKNTVIRQKCLVLIISIRVKGDYYPQTKSQYFYFKKSLILQNWFNEFFLHEME